MLWLSNEMSGEEEALRPAVTGLEEGCAWGCAWGCDMKRVLDMGGTADKDGEGGMDEEEGDTAGAGPNKMDEPKTECADDGEPDGACA